MQLHHGKHHKAAVDAYNKALGELVTALVAGDVDKVANLQSIINFNGGALGSNCSHLAGFFSTTNTSESWLPTQQTERGHLTRCACVGFLLSLSLPRALK